MAPSPHLSARIAVLVLSLLVTALASTWAMRTRGYPGDLPRWPGHFVSTVVAGVRSGGGSLGLWVGMGVYSAAITALHFWGIASNTYTTFQYYDWFTHAASGAGVAALLYLTFHGRPRETRPAGWIVPAVLAFGAGFEIYEFVFKDFWYTWSPGYYLADTVFDLVAGVGGGAAFVAAVVGYRYVLGR